MVVTTPGVLVSLI